MELKLPYVHLSVEWSDGWVVFLMRGGGKLGSSGWDQRSPEWDPAGVLE